MPAASTDTPTLNPATTSPPRQAQPGTATLTRIQQPTVVDSQVTALQEELVSERGGRRVERWAWSAGAGALLVMLAFDISATCGVVIALVYFAWLIVFGRICGVEGVEQALVAAKGLLPGGNEADQAEES